MSELNNDLFVTLGELADGQVAQTGPSGDFVYIDISSIDRETKKITETKHLAYAQAPSRAKQVLKAGDVLVSMTRPNLNAVALVPTELAGAIGSTGFHVLRSSWLHPKYLLALVQTHSFIDAMSSVVQGALYPAVRPRDVSAYRFKFETPAQQIRIVEKLEELLTDLDAGVAELKAAQKKLAQYRQSLLKSAVEGALTAQWREDNPATESGAQLLERILQERRARWETKQLAKFAEQGKTPPKEWQKKYPEPVQPDTTDLPPLPEGWVWASVDQLSFVVRGASPRPAGDPRYFGGDIPWITVGSLTADENMFLDSVNQFVTEAGRDASRYIEPETLLLTNSGATLGVPKITRIAGCINDGSVALLELDESRRKYLYWFLRTQTMKLRATNQGAAQPNLNTDIVKRICVPVCSLNEMQTINNLLESVIEEARPQERNIEMALKQCSAQRQNILRVAFSGQLVPQDPNDQPASVLLERIRAQRMEQSKQPKPRKTKKKEITTVTRKLVDVLIEAGDWLPAQEAFRRCGIADSAQTEKIEALYAELRALDKSQHLSVKAVFDLVDTPEGKKHRKVADHLKWVG